MRASLSIFFIVLAFNFYAQKDAFEKIQQLSDEGKYKEAIALSSDELKKLKPTDSLYIKIIRVRAYSYMDLNDFTSAVNDLKILISSDPKNINHYNTLAFAYWSLGNDADCLITINKTYELNKKDPLTLSNLSYYYNEAGKYKEGLGFASKGLDENPDPKVKALLLNNRGYSQIKLNEFESGLKDVNESIELFPDNSFAYYYRALANIGLRKTETVCDDLKKCKSLGGDHLGIDLLPKYCTLKNK